MQAPSSANSLGACGHLEPVRMYVDMLWDLYNMSINYSINSIRIACGAIFELTLQLVGSRHRLHIAVQQYLLYMIGR